MKTLELSPPIKAESPKAASDRLSPLGKSYPRTTSDHRAELEVYLTEAFHPAPSSMEGTRLVPKPQSQIQTSRATTPPKKTQNQTLVLAANAVQLHEDYRWEEAAQQYLLALERCAQGCDTVDWKTTARLHNNLAMVLRELNRSTEAEDHYIDALIAYDSVPQNEVADEVSSLLGNLAYLYFDSGRFADALKVQQRALDVTAMHLASDAAVMGQNERRTGLFAYFAGQLGLAQDHLNRALLFNTQRGGQQTSTHIELLIDLAAVHVRQDKVGEALRISSSAAQLLVKAGRGDDLLLAAVLNNIGCLQLRQGNSPAALDALNQGLRILQSHPVADDMARAEVFHNLALAHDGMGNNTSAATCRRLATELFSSISEDCRSKLQIAATKSQSVVSSASGPATITAEQDFMRQPVLISITTSSSVFDLPMKTETIEWEW